ncbi:potassium channel family protein [Niallia endozanthoxylica]|uniref:Potassium channel protein n=1 Tax=Niallia endozanthoxylica TaxID=2036016 RepID=A0A5J5HGQ6_9BACI|nr:potassium channel family protein [Niallia endozanthoxylica]KAA9019939.1 potassium channel protein [Niallia endozanthoxylica]
MPHQLFISFVRLPLLLRTFLIAISLIAFFGIIVHFLEPESFPTIFDGIWWAIITASTVGYGDYVPHSVIGKIAGILLLITSAGFLSSFFIVLATTAASRQNDHLEGKIKFKGEGHFIIVGWNERSREVIYSLINEQKTASIALIDDTLKKNPLPYSNVHYIQGRPNLDEVLMRASIQTADKVIITADPTKDELQADMHTILTLLAVKGLNPHVETIVEILTNEQIANASRAGADEIIQTNMLSSFVMLQSLASQDMVTSFLDLLYQLTEKKLVYLEAGKDQLEEGFTDVSVQLLQEGKILLGVKRGGATILNPPQPFSIEKHDQLIIIK